ncbi:MAG: serine protease [Marinilabiliales bacterium]|nr:MAG: serine protease [Marinilabiliales bacterium]
MKLKTVFPFILLLISFQSFAQIAPDTYYIQFTDKNNSPYSIDNPLQFLSQRAIDRRVNQGIEIVENDLPVNPQYMQGVADAGAIILNATKWLNGVTIYTESQTVVDNILALPYVSSALKLVNKESTEEKSFFKNESFGEIDLESFITERSTSELNYGAAENQIDQINGIPLHNMGYQGQGMVIAVLDGGFVGVEEHPVFDSLWANSQILGTRDFVHPYDQDVFTESEHGKSVLSTIGANEPGQMIGTAPKANFWLLRSEDVMTENIIEEYNWVSAAEFADSVGADVINSSLSYQDFDMPQWDHSYEDLDGNSAPSTIGADMVTSKGVLVCNSAGNSGDSGFPWNAAPADADNILSIGAVNESGIRAEFSSIGPTVDGRIKPAVMAQGSGTIVARNTEGVGPGSGTSYSSPIIAGMSACLWQANPTMTVLEIQAAIKESASRADSPDNLYGWGIPDYMEAHTIMTDIEFPLENKEIHVKTFPNPFNSMLSIEVKSTVNENVEFELYNLIGSLILSEHHQINSNSTISLFQYQLRTLNAGIYFLKINSNGNTSTIKLIKQ